MRKPLMSLLLLIGTLGAQSADIPELGMSPPAGNWTLRGGSLARTGYCASTPGMNEPLIRAWEAVVGGEIDQEPVVWGDRVFLSVTTGPEVRRLVVLSRSSGKEAMKGVDYRGATHRLDPTVWGEHVVVRASPTEFELLRHSSRLTRRMKKEVEGKLLSTLVHGNDLFVLTTKQVSCWDLKRRRVIWEESGTFRGSLTLRGDHLYILAYQSDGMLVLRLHSTDTGTLACEEEVGHHGGAKAPVMSESTIVATSNRVFIHYPRPILTDQMTRANCGILKRSPRRSGPPSLKFVGAVDAVSLMHGEVEACGFLKTPRLGFMVFTKDVADDRALELAGAGHHEEFLASPVPPSHAGSVIYVGGRSYDKETGTIYWEGPDNLLFRAVPAKECLLLVTGKNRLECWRRESTSEGVRTTELSADIIAKIPESRTVIRDGQVLSGKVSYDAKKKILKQGRRTFQISDIALILDGQNRPVLSTGSESLVWGLTQVSRNEYANACLKFVGDARRAGDLDLAEDLLATARDYGAQEKEAAVVERRLEAARKRPAPKKDALLERVKEKVEAALEARAAPFWSAMQALEEGQSSEQAALLGALLERDPQHEQALEFVKSMVPDQFQDHVTKDPMGAWELAAALKEVKINFVKPPTPDQADLTFAERQLGSSRITWRNDLDALETDQLLILTSVKDPGHLARCLSLGELVCDTLEELFASGTNKRDSRYPLELHLSESMEEYKRESSKRMRGFPPVNPAGLEWTAGHYNPRMNLSRIYLPKQKDAFESVMATYAHELTHHWIAERCPLFTTSERSKRNIGTFGFFLVEGIATFIEEAQFDLENRTCNLFNPKARAIDSVAQAPILLPWDKVYAFRQIDFAGLKKKPEIPVTLRWRLGVAKQLSQTNLFYEQAAATCHFLYHAEDGKYRDKLIELIRLHYTGKTKPDSVQRVVGMSPEKLGAAVKNWRVSLMR